MLSKIYSRKKMEKITALIKIKNREYFWRFKRVLRRCIFSDYIIKKFFYSKKGLCVEIRKLSTVESYCKKKRIPYHTIEPSKRRPVYSQSYFEGEEGTVNFYDCPSIGFVEFRNAVVEGHAGFISVGNVTLFDMAFDDEADRYDFNYDPICRIKCNRMISYYKGFGENIQCGIFLLGFFPFNYFHVTVEILSKLKYIDSVEKYKSYPLLIDEEIVSTSNYAQLLDAINVNNRKIIVLKKYVKYRVNQVIYVTDHIWIPWLLKENNSSYMRDFRMSLSSMHNISRSIARKENDLQIPTKIFLSRKNQQNTRLENGEDVEKIFVSYGFMPICIEDYCIMDQIAIFRGAKYVAGMAGAAFTNIIYCSPGTNIICFSPSAHKNYMYCTMAKSCGLNFMALDMEIIRREQWLSNEKMILDLEYCKRFLEQIDWD